MLIRLFGLLALFFGLATSVMAEPVGELVRLQGSGTLVRGDESLALRTGMEISQGDVIHTDKECRVLIQFNDDMELTLGAEASVRIQRYLFDAQARKGKAGLSLDGAFRVISGKIGKLGTDRVRLTTPAAILGIRGTDVLGAPLDGRLDVVVFSGEVQVANIAGKVVLGAGEGTVVKAPFEPPSAPKQWGKSKIERAVKTVAFD